MKKIIIAVFVLIAMIFTLTACKQVSGFEIEKETPEQAMSNAILAIKNINTEELTKYGVKEIVGKTDELSNARNKKIFEKLEFNILSIEEFEDTAKVKVEFKTKDLTTVPQDYANKSTALTIENNKLGDYKLDDAAMKLKYNDLFIELVDKCEYIEFTKIVEVSLTREGRSWSATVGNKFHNAVYGNLIAAQSNVFWPPVSTQAE